MNLKEIKNWLEEMGIENYDIIEKNGNYVVDVDGDVALYNKRLKTIPVQFGIVSGSFWCDDNKLTSLEGSPKSVGSDFYCNNNKLTSLKGSPENVGGRFWCNSNKITSLEGAPKNVGSDFWCEDNNLTSLEGSPKSVGRSFNCSFNNLTSLKGAPKTVSYFFCYNNPISKEIKEIDDGIENYNEFIKKYCFNKILEKL